MSQQRLRPASPHRSRQSEQVVRATLFQRFERLVNRLSAWREDWLVLRALRIAGEPNLVLDLPCGNGRFWPILTQHPNRLVLVADSSEERVLAVQSTQSDEIAQRIRVLQTSVSAINLGENAVDAIFCMRLLRQVESKEHRLVILRELHRVARDTVIVSLWVDGNYKAWARKLDDRRRVLNGLTARRQRVVMRREQIEAEFRSVGFQILSHLDFLPGYAMWRIYVLRKET